MKTHAKLSPSSAHIWTNCPGSVQLIEKAPPSEDSEASLNGTALHELLESCILDASNAYESVGRTVNGTVITPEYACGVQMIVDFVFEKRNEIGGVIEVETKLDLSTLHPDISGTLDILIYKKGKHLAICDAKFGQSPVEVKENKQLLAYAIGAAIRVNWDFETCEMIIAQPLAPHAHGWLRTWTVSREYLLASSKILVDAARLTEQRNAPLYRGDHCQYCRAKGLCPKQNEAMERALEVSTQNVIALPEVSTLTDSQLVRVLEAKKQIEDFIEAAQKAALFRLQSGETIEGLKLVAGRGRRVWADHSRAEVYLNDNLGSGAYKKELLSVTDAERVLPKKDIEHLWVKLEGSETVAHESDRRKAIESLGGKLILNKSKGAI